MSKKLPITQGYPFPDVITDVAEQDTMLVGEDFAHYLSVGVSALKNIRAALAASHVEPHSILDMPCGYGRVTRILRAAWPQADICVSENDAKALAFCARTFGATPLASQPDFAALDFRRKFDLIWVGSLITHLPADATSALLALVLRHLSAKGVAVVSSHGAYVAGKFRGAAIHPKVLSDYFGAGYGFANYPGTDVSVQRYGNSIVSREWLTGRVADLGGKLLFYRDHGWDNHHDVVAFARAGRRSRAPAPARAGAARPTRRREARTTVLPVGQNCHLGAALVRYGCLDSSLFKWANVSCRRIAGWLEGGAPVFSSHTAYRIAGSNYGMLDHRALMALLPSLPDDVLVNTVVYDHDGASYVHGVQLSKSRALACSIAQIERLNAEKIDHLAQAFMDALKAGEATLLRLEFDDGVDIAALQAMMAAARTVASCRFALIARRPPELPPDAGAVVFNLDSPPPPDSDVMNVTGSYDELEAIFATLSLARTRQKSAYIFDT